VHPLKDNPFFVLELPPGCTPMEIERQGKKLLGLLEVGVAAASTYATPLGPLPRTPDKVREATAILRDPKRRAIYEPWAHAPTHAPVDHAAIPAWPNAHRAHWWLP
jgi:hypothetical protein